MFTIAIIPPANSYEISIYEAYPVSFWFFIFGSIGCGICILVHQAFYGEDKSKWWFLGFSAIIFTNFILLFLPIFRGYAVYGREDTLTHIGYIKDIIFTGFIGKDNFYPIIHILPTNISYITGLDPMILVNIIPPIFSIFYIVSIYLLSTIVSKNRGQSLLITAFGSLLLFGGQSLAFAPSVQSFLLFPIVLFLYYKSRISLKKSFEYKLPLLLFLFLIPFFHPMTSLYLILLFLCLDVSYMIYKRINRSKESNLKVISKRRSSLIPSLLVSVIFFTWFSMCAYFAKSIWRVASWLFYETGLPQSMYYVGLFERADLTVFGFIETFFKIHGHHILYFIISFILFISTLRRIFFSRSKHNLNLVTFSLFFVVFGLLVFIFFTGDFIIGYERALKYPIFASTVLNGIGLYVLINRGKSESSKKKKFLRKKILAAIIIPILLSSSAIALIDTFRSPAIKSYNAQVTRMEIEGADWFLDNRNQDLYIDDIKVLPYRFADALLGKETEKKNIMWAGVWTYPPDHFNYSNKIMLGESYEADKYLMLNELSKLLYPEVYPEYPRLWRFNDEDFDRLNLDQSVNKIYINSGIEVYYVYKINYVP